MAGIEGGHDQTPLTSPIIAFRRKQTMDTRFAKHGLHRLQPAPAVRSVAKNGGDKIRP
jgi:hypothetical protein